MHDYPKKKVKYAVVCATPLFQKRGIITKGVKLALERSAEMLKEKSVSGIVVVGAYLNSHEEFITKKMATFLQKFEIPFEDVVQVPYRCKENVLDCLHRKFIVADENDETPIMVELTLVVGSNVAEFFCFKPIEYNGFRINGNPEEVEVSFSFLGALETCYFVLNNFWSGFLRLVMH